MKRFITRPVTLPMWGLVVGAIVALGIGGAGGSSDDTTDVAATDTTTTTRRATTTTTLSPEQQAAAAQAEAERLAAEQAAIDKAAAEAAAERAAAAKAAEEKAAAERAAAAPRTLSGTGSKVTDKFTLLKAGYKVTWSARGASDNFIVYIHGADGRKVNLVNEIPPEPSSGEEFFESGGGEFFLQVDASGLTWTITLTKV